MIIQHPSTPEDMRNPQEVVEQCMAEFFPYLLEIVMDYGFDAYDKDFQNELRFDTKDIFIFDENGSRI